MSSANTLNRIHERHQEIVKCRPRARTLVWWSSIPQQIKEMIQKCDTCCKNFQIRSEPLTPSTLLQQPWEKIGTDLFELKGKSYLLLVDYFSRYIEVIKLSSTTINSVVAAMKPIFAEHGIPDIVISDNSPQYSSQEFKLKPTTLSTLPAVLTTHKETGRLNKQLRQSRGY